MIPGSFAYHRPTSVQEAVGLLAQLGEDARAIAGGHSLIPMMKLRLATPAHLVDLGGVAGLKGMREDGADIVIGAMTTQHELINSDLLAAESADPARDLAADRRSAGALSRHARRQCRQWRSRQRHAGGDAGLDATYQVAGKNGDPPHHGARFLSGRLFHRAGAGRDRHRDPHSGAARRPRLRLRKAQAQDRRLRHRRRGRRADDERRQGRDLLDRPHQCRRDAIAAPKRRGKIAHRLDARCRNGEEGRGRRRGDHRARLRWPRAGRNIAPRWRASCSPARSRARNNASALEGETRQWPKPKSP